MVRLRIENLILPVSFNQYKTLGEDLHNKLESQMGPCIESLIYLYDREFDSNFSKKLRFSCQNNSKNIFLGNNYSSDLEFSKKTWKNHDLIRFSIGKRMNSIYEVGFEHRKSDPKKLFIYGRGIDRKTEDIIDKIANSRYFSRVIYY